MMNLIAVTSMKEQQDVINCLRDKLRDEFFDDMSSTIVQSGIAKLDVYIDVDGVRVLRATYKIVVIPLSMSLDTLKGYSGNTNININRVLNRLSELKTELISFVNSRGKH